MVRRLTLLGKERAVNMSKIAVDMSKIVIVKTLVYVDEIKYISCLGRREGECLVHFYVSQVKVVGWVSLEELAPSICYGWLR